MHIFSVIWRVLRLIFRIVRYTIVLALFLFLIQRSTYPLHLNWNAVSAIVRNYQFDYVSWEINALATKTSQALWGGHPYMTEEARSQFVRDYMADLEQARQLEGQIQTIYTDPTVADPEAVTADLRAARDALRNDLESRQPLAESILEGQVSDVLVDEGFGTLGQVLPPVSMHFTRMPYLLVVSPRDEIERAVELTIDQLPLEEIVEIEERIFAERDMTSLIVPLGGMALFPAMIAETTNLTWAVETFAHEWIHHYLFFFPLGMNYFSVTGSGRETMIINETTADTFGKEIRQLVLQRYYPELATANAPMQYTPTLISNQRQEEPLDLGRVMHVTRVRVDKALMDIQGIQAKADVLTAHNLTDKADAFTEQAQTLIVDMEDYMEERRVLLYENGWRIRKLNLAYFAFYGGYQAGGRPGVGGADPIGPAVQDIRAMSPTLHDFVVAMRGITTRDELLQVRDQMQASASVNQGLN